MNPFNPPSSDNSIQMFTTALVTDNVDTEGLGRVKVQYPWDNDSSESYWARVVTFMTGNTFGSCFLPEIGSEVLVAFLDGNIESPIIIGSLWNQDHLPPYTNEDENNNIRAIKSRSGHEIIFNDEESSESLEIKTASGHKIVFDDDRGSEKITIEDQSGNNIEIDSDKISINSNKDLSIKSALKLSMEASMIDIQADSVLTLKGGVIKIN